jgi:hypothetical protein
MRGLKGTTYQGGIRVPFFVRWPSVVKPGTQVDRIAAHIDVFPTLLEACGVSLRRRKIDGRSLLRLWQNPRAEWTDRSLFTQWHRGDFPEPFRGSAVRTQRWKLVNGKELYDLDADPGEKNDVAASQPGVTLKLRDEYEKWLQDVSATRGYAPPRIVLGTARENPVILTRQDWRGPRAGWDRDSIGHWEVRVAETATFEIKVRIEPLKEKGQLTCRLNEASLTAEIPEETEQVVLGRVRIPRGEGSLHAVVSTGGTTRGVHLVELRRM